IALYHSTEPKPVCTSISSAPKNLASTNALRYTNVQPKMPNPHPTPMHSYSLIHSTSSTMKSLPTVVFLCLAATAALAEDKFIPTDLLPYANKKINESDPELTDNTLA